MSEPGSQPPSELQLIEDNNEALRHLSEGAQSFASTLLWTKGQTEVVKTHLTVLSQVDKVFYVWVPQDFNFNKFNADLEQTQKQCIFSVSLPAAQIFFKTNFIEQDSAGLKFEIPTLVYKIQRRKDFRYTLPATYSLQIEYPDPLFPTEVLQKRVYDISAGGLSFITTEQDAPIYHSGLELEKVQFIIHLKPISAHLEIKHAKPLPELIQGQKCIRVGALFKNIAPEDQQHIASYVLSETSKHFGQFL